MIGDTIFALATAKGRAARGIVRISGPRALQLLQGLAPTTLVPRERAVHPLEVVLREGRLRVLALVLPAPASYTGEDTVEIHGPAAPLWLASLQRELRAAGARLAEPGEFTRRAVTGGKCDLETAEGLLALLLAETAAERRFARSVAEGAVAAELALAAEEIAAVRAHLESGLDFLDEETGSVDPGEWRAQLAKPRTRLESLLARGPRARAFTGLALVGAANAGKSSLCNALAGRAAVLVSDVAGTTRDVLRVELPSGAVVYDGPGDLEAPEAVEARALASRERLLRALPGALCVVDAADPRWPRSEVPFEAVVFTKLDLLGPGATLPAVPAAHAHLPRFATSCESGLGITGLAEFLAQCGQGAPETASVPLLDAAERALAALRRASALGSEEVAAEVAAAELALASQELGAVRSGGDVEGLLDRIFARFCLGK